MSRKYPDRWLAYTKFGAQVQGTSFIPMKVPLNTEFFVNHQNDSFTPDDAIDEIPKLGLVIDLTFTAKYYSPTEFTHRNVKHKKIYTMGHEVPKISLVNSFIRTVNDFLSVPGNKDKLVGVHCTHGLNRTGYFVCAYMILAQGKTPKEAIKLFNEARSHCMERANYLNSLARLTPGSYINAPYDSERRSTPTEDMRLHGNRYEHPRKMQRSDLSGNWRSNKRHEDLQQNSPPRRYKYDRSADQSGVSRNISGGNLKYGYFVSATDSRNVNTNYDQPHGSKDWNNDRHPRDNRYSTRNDVRQSSSANFNGDRQSNRFNWRRSRDVDDNTEC